MPRQKADDTYWMAEALSLAQRGIGRTSPNPAVGCVIVKNNRQIGTGWHKVAGGPHAEINALSQAGSSARGADLYVTLEPCSTVGRTGACTEAIIQAGVARVIAGSQDPNPRHKGRGFRKLKKAGIEVKKAVLISRTDALISAFTKRVTTGVPYLTLKMAMSMDGRITDKAGRSKWISCEYSRKQVRALRGKVDAVMVGLNTVRGDDPELFPSNSRARQPYRVVIDSRARTPLSSKLLSDARAERTVVIACRSCPQHRAAAIRRTGATLIQVAAAKGRVSMSSAMRALGKLGVNHVLCEGGAALAGSLIAGGLPDEYLIYCAPLMLGSKGCLPVIAAQSWSLAGAPRLKIVDTAASGDDLLVRCIPKGR